MRQVSRLAWQQVFRPAGATRAFQCAPRLAVTRAAGLRWPAQRLYSTEKPLTDREEGDAAQRKKEIEERKASQPSYQLFFTCSKCLTKSGHRISKQGYHHGTVLVNCPGCSNKHLISDHLKIFSDRGVTLEDIMKEKGELLKKGVLGADGDVEFFGEDGIIENEPKD